ncbi:MAG: hypothetical protein JNL65_03375 [Saprospiraceae bacterium]|nr:hypothetical protein [Saprospiraceae bacterium]HRG69814.1 hypothetical protein [Saprospiraceae bacterium]
MKIKNGFIQVLCLVILAICLSLVMLYMTNPFIDFTEKLAHELLRNEQNYALWANQY